MSQMPTGTVTFLFTDIQGSTRLWESSPAAMRPALTKHDQILRHCIETSNGHVFKTIGDAFCAVFASALDAVHAALAAQLALAAEPWETEKPLSVRMAMHTGSAEERDGDYFGPPLSRVARLLGAGHGGQTLLSQAAQEQAGDLLPAGVGLLDMGSRRLKDLSRPENVFQLLHPGLPAEFPPLRSLDNPDLPNNLPQQVSSFIGREKEITQVKALLGKARLLTLTGSGGTGKTRLSMQVAADLLDQVFDGVWLVELAPLSDPALVPAAVAAVLGVQEQAGQPIQGTLTDWLKTKRLLLVLDNCEHLVAACAFLAADILRVCPQVQVLASSREPLNVAGEQVYRVPPLALPDPKQAQTALSLSPYEAATLFTERAKAVLPVFTVTDGNASAVAQVCFRLDGIPLALELAAARVRSLSVEQINARLDQRFHLLTGGSRVALPRQQTLRSLIDWSYDLLTEPEKAMLRRLSVFVGGWTLEAAEHVCCGEAIEDWEVLDLLTALADKSLVQAELSRLAEPSESVKVPDTGPIRYRLLETIREYALARLSEAGEVESVQALHFSWCLSLAKEAEPGLTGPEQGMWLARLEVEHDNLRAALTWCLRLPDEGPGLQLAGSLWRFWDFHGHWSEGRQWLGKALGRGAESGTLGSEGLEGEAASVRAKALNGAGNLARYQGEYTTAQVLYEEALFLRRQVGDQKSIASSLINLGNLSCYQGDYARSRTFHEESLLIFRRLEDPSGISSVLNALGSLAFDQSDYAAARLLYEESLLLRRPLGDQYFIAVVLSNLGNVLYLQGEYAQAQVKHEEGLSLRRQLGDQKGIADSLLNLGNVAADQSDHASAMKLYQESLTYFQRLGDQHGIISALQKIARTAQEQNQSRQAAHLLGATGVLREAIGRSIPSGEREEGDTLLAAVRSSLGDAAFAAAWEEGRALTWEQAAAYALSETHSFPLSSQN